MKRIPPEKTKELRGLVLYFLYNIYPCNIAKVSVYKSFYQYWQTDQIDRALAYLEDKGYVVKDSHKDPFGEPFEVTENWQISSKGIDLCERTIQDDGVLAEIGG
jgi:hypothetical protein